MRPSFPSKELLSALAASIAYDPETGDIWWAVDRGTKVKAGTPIKNRDSHGYVTFKCGGRNLKAHAAIWFLKTGKWPIVTVDHKNGVRDDNRWRNLREATYSQNECNKPKQARSIAKGVIKRGNRWSAGIRVNRKHHHLGTFDSLEEASAAYRSAALRLHGEFARFE